MKDIAGVFWWESKVKGTVKVIIHYSAHPVYREIPDYLNYRMQQDGTDEETVQREYNLKFLDSAVAVFSFDLINKNAVGEYEDFYDETADYYAGLDTSTVGSDYTCFPILKYKNSKLSLVYLYRKRHQTSEYHLYQVGELIKRYRIKKVGVEITGGVGQLYLEKLTREFRDVDFQAIRTTGDSKPLMISSMVLALEKSVLEYPSTSPLVEEMLSFRREGRKLEAAPGKHDDSVMGAAFAIAVSPFNKKRGIFDNVEKYW